MSQCIPSCFGVDMRFFGVPNVSRITPDLVPTCSREFLSANFGECGGRWAREVLFLGHLLAPKAMGRWENLVPGSRRWPTEFWDSNLHQGFTNGKILCFYGPWLPVRKLPEKNPWYQFTKGIQFTRWLIMIDHHRPFHWSEKMPGTEEPLRGPPGARLCLHTCSWWGPPPGRGVKCGVVNGPWHLGFFQWAITILGGSSHLVSGS